MNVVAAATVNDRGLAGRLGLFAGKTHAGIPVT
jgi:hypothetical protein